MQTIRAKSTGFLAYTAFTKQPFAVVNGDTSKGLFIDVEGHNGLFLSYELWRSPYTINLGTQPAQMQSVHNGSVVVLLAGQIQLPEQKLAISVPDDTLWMPPDAEGQPGPVDEQKARLTALAEQMAGLKGDLGFTPLFPCLLGNADAPALNAELDTALSAAQAAQTALRGTDPNAILDALAPLFGLGRGLTPSGDDFITGMLLLFNRWPRAARPKIPVSALNRRILEAARQKTTRLAATQMEMASAGIGDERLLAALDHVVTGQGRLEQTAQMLHAYGSSSGADALAGIAAGLLFIQ